MARNFNELRGNLDRRLDEHPEGETIRQKIREDLCRELEAHAVTLAKLRKARGLTQLQLARELDVSQAQVSRVETQTDLYLSTLAGYIAAMGGELVIAGVFDGNVVPLTISEVSQPEDAETSGSPLHAVT